VTWIIYCHIHKDTHRRYIGLTKMTMMQRWNRHVYDSVNSRGGKLKTSHFPNAIRKYGKDAFEHIEFLTKYQTLEAANAAEEFAIEFWCTRDPDFGFNIAKGGGTHNPNLIRKNPWDDPSYRAKITTASKGKRHSRTTKIQISHLAKSHWNNPIIRTRNSLAIKEALSTPESKIKRSAISKEIFSRPEVRAKVQKTLRTRVFSSETKAKLRAIRLSRTHCKHGHSLRDAYINRQEWRLCKTCSIIRGRKRKLKNSGIVKHDYSKHS
jgi:GIY-YIG catalytic domain